MEKYHNGNGQVTMVGGYSRSLARIESLYQEAKTDFPGLRRNNVEVSVFGPSRFENMIGIQFSREDVPEDYTQVSQDFLCDYYKF